MLRNSEKLSAIGHLASGIAHEIRNPLTAIKGFVQLMPTAGVHNLERYSTIVKSKLSRVEAIVSEMLIQNRRNYLPLTAQANMQNV